MNHQSDSEIAFRQWMRAMLEQMLGDQPGNVHRVCFPVKRFVQIAIEEVYRYLSRKQWRAPQLTAADILEIDPKSVSRAIKNHSK